MQSTINNISETQTKLTITADASDLTTIKQTVLKKLAPSIKMAGFRDGNVPPALAEKQLGNQLQGEVLEESINQFYRDAVLRDNIRVVSQPKVEIIKYVPYSTLEFSAEVEVIAKIKLPDYKNLSVKKADVKITASDVKEILDRLLKQSAEYVQVKRAAKDGDRVIMNFEGTDDKGEAVKGAKGTDFPLSIGSKTFIPGFEENLIGLKENDEKTFVITFPKDYHLKALQSKKVTFKVNVNKVEETKLATLDDAFAAKVGPFKNLDELKEDIKKQLKIERDNQAEREYEDNIIKSVLAKTKVILPESLLDEQMEAVDKEFKQNLTYRGESFTDYLENNMLTEEDYRSKELKPVAEERLKAGLVLSEIANVENIVVSQEEIDIRIMVMKKQYSDVEMQKELDKPDAKRDIGSRLLTEKTIAKLVSYNSSK